MSVNTTGVIAKRLGVSRDRIEYFITARGYKPIGRAANARFFSDQTVELLAADLRAIAAKRSKGQTVAPAVTSPA